MDSTHNMDSTHKESLTQTAFPSYDVNEFDSKDSFSVEVFDRHLYSILF